VAVVCAAVLSSAQPTIKITEYTVGFPFDITVGPDGAMWFTNYSNIGRITANGAIMRYALPANSIPTKITTGPDGALWFTASNPNAIGRLTTTGVFTMYPLPDPNGEVWGITTGADGALWFTEWAGGNIGRITTSGVITEFPLPSPATTIGITLGPDGAVWFTEANCGNGKIGRIKTGGTITEYVLPPPYPNWAEWGFSDIVAGPDGALWVTDGDYRVLRVKTDGSFTEYAIAGCPPCQAGTQVIRAGPDAALWFTLFAGNSIGRITTKGAIAQYPIPTANSQPTGMATGLDGSIWFVEHAAGKLAQIVFDKSDTTPPQITASATPKVLWPPNGRMVPVVVSGTIKDAGSGVLTGSVEYDVLDEYGKLQLTARIVLDAAGNYTFSILLQASRRGNDTDGRHYLIRVSAKDKAGNRGVKWASVIVPH
jgi:virginiamycin B lyase